MHLPGEKSDDKDSPAYVPLLFCFTDSPAKRRANHDLERWRALKRRHQVIEEGTSTTEEQSAEEPSPEPSLDQEIDIMMLTESHRSLSCQTDVTVLDLAKMEAENKQMKEELKLFYENNLGYPKKEQLQEDKKLLKFYTGLECFTVFMALFEFITKDLVHSKHHKISAFYCHLLTLMKLRLNLKHCDLAFRFNVCHSTISRILSKWIHLMDMKMSDVFIKLPDRDAIQRTMPFCFRVHYGLRVTTIIDCFELFIKKPSSLLAKSCTWSQYKHYNTAKYLIAISPQGVITFISKGWGGRVSDKYITENSLFLKNILLPGDLVLADRSFNIAESLGAHGATLHIPAFTKGKDQLLPSDIEKTRNIANVRIHVERIIGSVHQRYTILNATDILPKEICQPKDGIVMLDEIVRVCCALHNLCDGIVPFE